MAISSRDYCPYTCPAVDEAIETMREELEELVPSKLKSDMERAVDLMMDRVKKHGTEKLREALRSCCSDLDEARTELERANERIRDLEQTIDHMETFSE